MYTVENINTLDEINRTTHENINPRGSATNVSTIGVEKTDIKFHSIIKIC